MGYFNVYISCNIVVQIFMFTAIFFTIYSDLFNPKTILYTWVVSYLASFFQDSFVR